MRMIGRVTWAVALATVVTARAHAAGTIGYRVLPIVPDEPFDRVVATAANIHGQVVGYVERRIGTNQREFRGFLFEHEQFTLLDQFWSAVDINDSGQILGHTRAASTPYGVLDLRDGSLIELDPDPENYTVVQLMFINNNGIVVMHDPYGGLEPINYHPQASGGYYSLDMHSGTIEYLGGWGECYHGCYDPGFVYDVAIDFTNNGVALFNKNASERGYYDPSLVDYATLARQAIDYPSSVRNPNPDAEFRVYDVNDAGWVVGDAWWLDGSGQGGPTGMLHRDGETIFATDYLDPATGWEMRYMFRINNENVILGRAIDLSALEDGLKWVLAVARHQPPMVIEFPFDSGFTLSSGLIADFTDSGHILLGGQYATHSFLLVPIPEPASLTLLALATCLFAPRRRRR